MVDLLIDMNTCSYFSFFDTVIKSLLLFSKLCSALDSLCNSYHFQVYGSDS